MRLRLLAASWPLGLLAGAVGHRDALPAEAIDLDLPPGERWRSFAQKYRAEIISKAAVSGSAYERGLGTVVDSWMKVAPVSDEYMAEYRSIVEVVNHPEVTLQRLVLTDMWHAVHAPGFECTGLLAAMPNGTVIHGRNIDYDVEAMAKQAAKAPKRADLPEPRAGSFWEGTFLRGGKPIVSFVAQIGSLGIHTGMRLGGGWSFNSNARLVENNMTANLLATEQGSLNFPWVARKLLLEVPDFDSAVRAFNSTSFNAPNYFILAGAGSYEGVVITADRGGRLLPGTPAVQSLSAERGVWHLVQTNDDLTEAPLDARRGLALSRLAQQGQSRVSEAFVLQQMKQSPTTNSDTLLTWVANPSRGTHRTILRTREQVAAGLMDKLMHRAMHLKMPQDLPDSETTPKPRASFLATGRS